jgi:hypothetical protein
MVSLNGKLILAGNEAGNFIIVDVSQNPSF